MILIWRGCFLQSYHFWRGGDPCRNLHSVGALRHSSPGRSDRGERVESRVRGAETRRAGWWIKKLHSVPAAGHWWVFRVCCSIHYSRIKSQSIGPIVKVKTYRATFKQEKLLELRCILITWCKKHLTSKENSPTLIWKIERAESCLEMEHCITFGNHSARWNILWLNITSTSKVLVSCSDLMLLHFQSCFYSLLYKCTQNYFTVQVYTKPV